MAKQLSHPVDPAVEDRQRGGPPASEGDAYSLAEFCGRHRISVQLYYKLVQQGLAPVTFRVGTRVLVSKESAARWRAEREAASASARA